MFRAPDRDGLPCIEGRVLAIKGEWAEVISSLDEDNQGKVRPGAKRYKVPLARLMKIDDWLAEQRSVTG